MHLRFFMIAVIGIIASTTYTQDTGIKFATPTPVLATPAGAVPSNSVVTVPPPVDTIDATPTDVATLTATPMAEAVIEPEKIVVRAEDGALLVGDFYEVDPLSPTIILLHQLYTTRRSWEPIIGPLLGAHYNVLAVDLRGYGESSSSINWTSAVVDVQLWFDWLRTETDVRPDAISTMGSSMGSTLAIVGCANDALCKTAIAISPGWDYYGIEIEDSLAVGFQHRPLLILYSERDRYPSLDMPQIEAAATGVLTIEVFPANPHGMDLIKLYEEDTLPLILDWLTQYSGRF